MERREIMNTRSYPYPRRKTILLCFVGLCLASCSRTITSIPPTPPIPTRGFVDIEPGWRIVTIVPLRRDAPSSPWAFAPPRLASASTNGLSVEAKLAPGSQFAFEESIYRVGSNIDWQQSNRSVDAKRSPLTAPTLSLFPEGRGLFRLLFLTRASDTNYNTAFLRAGDRQALEALTARVRANPDANCGTDMQSVCRWIPLGVAVRPEKRNGRGAFIPVL